MSFGIELIIILFLATFTQAVIGFGFGAIFIGLLAFFFPLHQVILLSFIFAIPIQFFLVAATIRYRLSWDAIKLAFLGLLGLPIGIYAFSIVNVNLLEKIFGCFLVICVGISILDRLRLPDNRGVFISVGLMSGFFGALFGSSGPFISLYLLTKPELKRVNHIFILNSIFVLLSFTLTVYYFFQGELIFIDLTSIGYGVLVALFGTLTGYVFGGFFSNQWYRWIVQMVILIMGIMLFFK